MKESVDYILIPVQDIEINYTWVAEVNLPRRSFGVISAIYTVTYVGTRIWLLLMHGVQKSIDGQDLIADTV